jgi:SWI/SNF-related matrix-associated actin-dependent regulator 1 of chromatin subfamily A
VAHYDVLARHEDEMRERNWDLVVVDEAHYLKNPKAQRTQAVFGRRDLPALDAGRKLVLTGTPIPNRPIELYGILRWPDPQAAGSWVHYARRYCAGKETRYGWDVSGASNLGELQDKRRSTVMVRRLKKDVLSELPTKRRQVILLDPADIEGAERALDAERSGMAQAEATLAEARIEAELDRRAFSARLRAPRLP